jgi:hypothetical protein
LNVEVGVVEQIEHLRLQLQFLGFPDRKTAGQRNVDPIQPGTVERIQADSRRRPSAIDARRGVRGVFAEAVSFRLSLPVTAQLLNDRFGLVQGLNKPAYGRPEENSMTLFNFKPEAHRSFSTRQ